VHPIFIYVLFKTFCAPTCVSYPVLDKMYLTQEQCEHARLRESMSLVIEPIFVYGLTCGKRLASDGEPQPYIPREPRQPR
jgi:hypothetical protein